MGYGDGGKGEGRETKEMDEEREIKGKERGEGTKRKGEERRRGEGR